MLRIRGSDFFPDFAEKFRRDTQIGSYLGIWQALSKRRILFQKRQITLLRSRAEILQHPVLQLHVFVFDNYLEDPVELGNVAVQEIQIFFFDLNNGAGFNRLDKQPAGQSGVKAADIGDPAVCLTVNIGRKLNVMLSALLIHRKHFQTAIQDKRIMPARKAFLQNCLPTSQITDRRPLRHQLPFLLCKRKIGFKVFE